MNGYFENLPESVKDHLKGITRTSGMDDNEESLEKMAEAWMAKKEAFEKQLELNDMEEVDLFDADEEQAALVMTYSGSLINIGSMGEEHRSIDYTSIGLRKDVPDSVSSDNASLASDIDTGSEVLFEQGPITKSSPVYKIAVCQDEIDFDKQDEIVENATLALTQQFAEINKTIIA